MREDVRHMNGNITNICTNDYGNQTYGFILGEDGRDFEIISFIGIILSTVL